MASKSSSISDIFRSLFFFKVATSLVNARCDKSNLPVPIHQLRQGLRQIRRNKRTGLSNCSFRPDPAEHPPDLLLLMLLRSRFFRSLHARTVSVRWMVQRHHGTKQAERSDADDDDGFDSDTTDIGAKSSDIRIHPASDNNGPPPQSTQSPRLFSKLAVIKPTITTTRWLFPSERI